MIINKKLRPTDSSSILREKGYSFYYFVEKPRTPEFSDVYIDSYLPGLTEGFEWLEGKKLYKHQYDTIRALESGKNVVLIAGTGSGKTEAWVFYALKKALTQKFTALAIYPTLALSNDQVYRVEQYSSKLGIKITKIDRGTRDELRAIKGSAGIRQTIANSQIILTNPAFLFSDIKRFVEKQTKSYLYPTLRDLDLLVIDELDFYSPRSIALILGMLKILFENLGTPKQIVIMTATLSNPNEMCQFLHNLNNKECVVIRGDPFNVENRTYVIVGKNLRDIWEKMVNVKDHLRQRELDEDIIKSLSDFSYFEKNSFRVLNYLRSLGVDIPLPSFSIEEILEPYMNDSGLTIVFTRSINRAEEIYRKLLERNHQYYNKVAVHHHLIDKKRREEIEERARKGEIKVILSPRTLSQGIDIGIVVRVVHVGLPEEVREFKQREGRKGRRENIEFTESIIIPQGIFDINLLSKGKEAFRKWLELPLERTLINSENNYLYLFTGIAKLKSTWMNKELSEKEIHVLMKTKVLDKNRVINKKRLENIWFNLNFYEYSPPYGIPRSLIKDEKEIPIEPIGRCDLVEKFQIGCFDLANEGIVLKMDQGKSRVVSRIYEFELTYKTISMTDHLREAQEQYRDIKLRWGETPELIRDIHRAKVLSIVDTVVYPPKFGFGQLIKIPNRVNWIVRSEKPRLVKINDNHHVVFDQRRIVVPVNTFGEYRDYTYGLTLEAKEGEDPILIRLGLAYIMIILRRILSYSILALEYSVDTIGGKVFFELHEPESSGLLEKIDWSEIRKFVESYNPDELDLILLSQIDDIAWTDMLTLNISWDTIRKGALRVLDYLLLTNKVEAFFKDKKIVLPKPSKALKIIAIDTMFLQEDSKDIPLNKVFITTFDGEETITLYESFPAIRGVTPPDSIRSLEMQLWEKILYEGYKLVFPSQQTVALVAEKCDLRGLKHLLNDQRVLKIDISEVLEREGINPASLDITIRFGKEVIEDLSVWVTLSDLHKHIMRIRDNDKKIDIERIKEFLQRRIRAIYILYLILNEIKQK